MSVKRLIVNADDFGQSRGINRGIVRAHEEGIVTSASLMVRWPAAAAAAEYARAHDALSVGLHIDLCEWKYENGGWLPVYVIVALDDGRSIAAEIRSQIEQFERLVGRPPSHLDSHQHFHRREPALAEVERIGLELGVPVRGRSPHVKYCAAFYGQTAEGAPYPEGISLDRLRRVFSELEEGCTELGCHPAAEIDFDTTYGRERLIELEVLCDPRIKSETEACGIELCSFHDVASVKSESPRSKAGAA